MKRKYNYYYNDFYKSKAWKAVRLQVLKRDSFLCQKCKRAGRVTPASTVHHIISIRVDYSKRLDPKNLEVICAACHNAEHNERAFDKQKKIKKLKEKNKKDIFIFKENPEVF